MTWTVALPEVVLAIGVMVLLMLGVFRGNSSTGLIANLAALLLVGVLVVNLFSPMGTGFDGLFVENSFTSFAKILILVASAVAVIMSVDYCRREDMQRFEYPILMLTATLGMLMMVSANDFIALYLGIELQSLSLYEVFRPGRAVFRHVAVRLFPDLRLQRPHGFRRRCVGFHR
jgi:NADH-quinone oxidoreductase subunit N